MRRTIQAEQDPDAWVPACAGCCPECFLLIRRKPMPAFGGLRNDCTDNSNFVTPAEAGVQRLSSNGGLYAESLDTGLRRYDEAFGFEACARVRLFRTAVRQRGNDEVLFPGRSS